MLQGDETGREVYGRKLLPDLKKLQGFSFPKYKLLIRLWMKAPFSTLGWGVSGILDRNLTNVPIARHK